MGWKNARPKLIHHAGQAHFQSTIFDLCWWRSLQEAFQQLCKLGHCPRHLCLLRLQMGISKQVESLFLTHLPHIAVQLVLQQGLINFWETLSFGWVWISCSFCPFSYWLHHFCVIWGYALFKAFALFQGLDSWQGSLRKKMHYPRL